MEQQERTKQKFEACMLLAAVGDAIGYRKGQWEWNKNGPSIHQEMMAITNNKGILFLELNPKDFPYSDDTLMHLATARGLLQSTPEESINSICQKVAKQYKACWQFVEGRGTGGTCRKYVTMLKEDGSNWNTFVFDKNALGCGGAMRAACIGLFLVNDIKKLVAVSIETGRTTHHNPIGFLGSLIAAYFTALALKGEDPNNWIYFLFSEALPLARQYVRCNRDGDLNLKEGEWDICQLNWKKYANLRKLSVNEKSKPWFPQSYGPVERQQFYKDISLSDWPGTRGIDSVLVAYDSILGARDNWEELGLRAMLHGGDSDSTGTIAAAWFGAAYGFKGVPKNHIEKCEGREEALQYGAKLFKLVYKQSK